MMPRYLLKIGMGSSLRCEVSLEEIFNDSSLSFYNLYDSVEKDIYLQDFNSVNEAKRYRDVINNSISMFSKHKDISIINEATRKELVKASDKARKQRAKSKNIVVHYKGVMNTRGWIVFNTTSQFTIGKSYTQYIRLNEAKDIKYFKEFKERDIVRLFMSGDISVHCTCPDYRYRFSYMSHNMGYGIFKETRFPKIRNPQLKGALCKHLLAVMAVYNFNWTRIAKDMPKTKYWRGRISSSSKKIKPKGSKNKGKGS